MILGQLFELPAFLKALQFGFEKREMASAGPVLISVLLVEISVPRLTDRSLFLER